MIINVEGGNENVDADQASNISTRERTVTNKLRHLYLKTSRQNQNNMATIHGLDLNANVRIIGQIMPRL